MKRRITQIKNIFSSKEGRPQEVNPPIDTEVSEHAPHLESLVKRGKWAAEKLKLVAEYNKLTNDLSRLEKLQKEVQQSLGE